MPAETLETVLFGVPFAHCDTSLAQLVIDPSACAAH